MNLDEQELIATRILNGSMSRKEIVEYVNKLQKQLQVEKNTNKNLSKECQKYFDAGMDMQQEIAELKKYDARKFIKKENIIKSPNFKKKEIDLMNLGIALYENFDKIYDDESEE